MSINLKEMCYLCAVVIFEMFLHEHISTSSKYDSDAKI